MMQEPGNAQELTNAIDELNQQAWQLRVVDSKKAMDICQETLLLLKEVDYLPGKAAAIRTLAFTHIRFSRHNEAMELAKEAEEMFSRLGDESGLAAIYSYYGVIHRSQGDYAASLSNLFRSLDFRKTPSDREGESLTYYHIGVTYRYLGNLELALDFFLRSIAVAKEIHSIVAESYSLQNIGNIYQEFGDLEKALEYFTQSLTMRRILGDKWGEAGSLDSIGYVYYKLKQTDLALENCEKSLHLARSISDKKGEGNALLHLAEIFEAKNEQEKMLQCISDSLHIREEIGDKKGQAELLFRMAQIKYKEETEERINSRQLDFLNRSLALGNETNAQDLLYRIHQGFYRVYKNLKNYELALEHLEISDQLEKEVRSNAINQKIHQLEITHRVEQSRKEAEIFRLKNIELAALYEEIKIQKEETEIQKQHVEAALSDLKSTQTQLIQREKMASLGELTAGIAHEIQNPLNFVNNFSELNKELVEEATEAVKEGNMANTQDLLKMLRENAEKINQHGKRADNIVKGMLLHSRTSTGEKELVEINALAEEYFRLAYQGLRSKDNTFHATLVTDYDPSLLKIPIIPQDIGRVLLNLYNNAFYAITEKAKTCDPNYKPTITVVTRQIPPPGLPDSSKAGLPDSKEAGGKRGAFVEMTIRDNGTGIPQKQIEKIFQPFFTTKPTGKGTGLGLSLSYEIITKGHGGEISVKTREGEFSEFVLRLPVD